MPACSFTATALRATAGVSIWVLHFFAIYGFTALACAHGFAQVRWLGVGIVTWTVSAATLIAMAASLFVIARALGFHARPVGGSRGARRDFVAWMTAMVAGFALIAIVWETVPLFIVPTCG